MNPYDRIIGDDLKNRINNFGLTVAERNRLTEEEIEELHALTPAQGRDYLHRMFRETSPEMRARIAVERTTLDTARTNAANEHGDRLNRALGRRLAELPPGVNPAAGLSKRRKTRKPRKPRKSRKSRR